jgi:hypothetical protein
MGVVVVFLVPGDGGVPLPYSSRAFQLSGPNDFQVGKSGGPGHDKRIDQLSKSERKRYAIDRPAEAPATDWWPKPFHR